MATRYLIGVGLGSVVTFLLFFLMQAVIATDEARLDEGAKGKLLDFVRLEEDQELQTKPRKPKPTPPPAQPRRPSWPGGEDARPRRRLLNRHRRWRIWRCSSGGGRGPLPLP